MKIRKALILFLNISLFAGFLLLHYHKFMVPAGFTFAAFGVCFVVTVQT